jgi:cell division protein FtsN
MTTLRIPTTLYGFLAGLVSGLFIAATAAVILTRAPLPFINRVTPSTENVTPDAGDPNRSLFSPHIPGPAPAADAAPTPPPAAAPAATPPAGGGAGAASGAGPGAPAVPGAMGAGAAAAAEAADSGPRLMLQVGAFKSSEDADAARARLALLGLDAKVTEVQVEGKTLYRVRLGPYGQLDDLNGIRRTLSENGMEPQLVHVR